MAEKIEVTENEKKEEALAFPRTVDVNGIPVVSLYKSNGKSPCMGTTKVNEELVSIFEAVEENLSKGNPRQKETWEKMPEYLKILQPWERPITVDDLNQIIKTWTCFIDFIDSMCRANPIFETRLMQPHKTFSNMLDYIFGHAKIYAINNYMAMVEDATVFQWIIDYYMNDDLEAVEQREAAEKAKIKAKEKKAKGKSKTTKTKKTKTVDTKVEKGFKPDKHLVDHAEVPVKTTEDETGQMSLFDLM